ncbi:MAG: hypothetical protein N3A55_00665 [Methylohalobius sp.]|nr:hypothetical protein [Methylohalobius sp.]
MKKTFEPADLSSLVAVIFHLMTCYSLKPCPRLAGKVAEHLELLLEAESKTFGSWQGTLTKLRDHWRLRACVKDEWSRLIPSEENFH